MTFCIYLGHIWHSLHQDEINLEYVLVTTHQGITFSTKNGYLGNHLSCKFISYFHLVTGTTVHTTANVWTYNLHIVNPYYHLSPSLCVCHSLQSHVCVCVCVCVCACVSIFQVLFYLVTAEYRSETCAVRVGLEETSSCEVHTISHHLPLIVVTIYIW